MYKTGAKRICSFDQHFEMVESERASFVRIHFDVTLQFKKDRDSRLFNQLSFKIYHIFVQFCFHLFVMFALAL